jgi:bifunctional DNA-binding transcriptional regulator/antitoxin component of YhaV-PrlF toxin-antitoxin module
MKVKICQFDEQFGVLLPDELLAAFGWKPGDVVEVEVENDTLKIARVETVNERGMRVAQRAMNNYRGALETFAKE